MLSHNNLDELLDAAAPRITRRTEELHQMLLEVGQGAEAQSRRIKRTGRFLLAGAALTGVIGLGGAATAGGLIPTWTPWTGASGESCSFLYTVDPANSAAARQTQDAPRPVYSDPATVEANAYLAQYDYNSIDRDAAVNRFEDKLRVERAAMPADQRPPAPDTSTDEFQHQAVDALVEGQLAAHMKAAGFDPDSVVVHGAYQCRQ